MNRPFASLIRSRPAAVIVTVVIVAALLGGILAFGASGGTVGATPTPSAVPSATASPTSRPTSSPSPTPSPTASPSPTPSELPAPLTGLVVPRAAAARHPIAVMVDDHPNARPQAGLSEAAVVWHAPAEFGIPRYMLLFGETVPGTVGPVRSARDYFIAWAAEWRPLFAHVGGSPGARRTLRDYGNGEYVYDADEYAWTGSFWRSSDRVAPHNLYTDGELLRDLAQTRGALDADLQPAWQFARDAARDDRPGGGSIRVAFPENAIRYDYDASTNTYLRSVSGGRPQVDAGTGERVAPKNVVIMLVEFAPLNDGTDKQRLEARVIGSGTAWVATNGRTVRGTWRKDGITSPTLFFDANGEPVTFTAGQTFIQVMPTGTAVRITPGAE